MSFPLPENEKERLAALETYKILDTISEQEYDDIAQLAAQICNTPMCTVALLDKDRKWHKAKYGLDKESVPREVSICSHTIMGDQPLVVNDTHEHETFRDIGMVTNPPNVRFYAGVPLINNDGYALGSLCVIDVHPSELNDFQYNSLVSLARQIIALLELRRNTMIMEKQKSELEFKQTKIEKLNQELTDLSLTDELTGLWNRRALNNELKKELNRGQRNKQTMAFMMLDIDNFKKLNDDHGHSFGDDAIKNLAVILENETRETDFCIRFGGDEFIILMPDTNHSKVDLISNRIRKKFEEQKFNSETLTVSIGITIINNYDVSEDDLLKLTDDCLYKAKHQGRNCIVIETI